LFGGEVEYLLREKTEDDHVVFAKGEICT
jgi:hypothetical protein